MSYFARLASTLLANGYAPLPITIPGIAHQNPKIAKSYGKAPGYLDASGKQHLLASWIKLGASRDPVQIADWAQHTAGVGLVCGDIVGVDIDSMNDVLATEIDEHLGKMIGEIGPTRTGQAPKRLILLRATDKIASTSKKWEGLDFTMGLDILSTGRQFVAYGQHATTARDYVWRDGSPENVRVDQLPTVSNAQIIEFLQWVDERVQRFMTLTATAIPAPARMVSTIQTRLSQPKPLDETPRDKPTPEALVAAMRLLPNDGTIDYHGWVRIAFAVWESSKPDAELGWSVFNEWCSKGATYDEAGAGKKFQEVIRDSKGAIGFGTIVSQLQARGLAIPAAVEFRPEVSATRENSTTRLARFLPYHASLVAAEQEHLRAVEQKTLMEQANVAYAEGNAAAAQAQRAHDEHVSEPDDGPPEYTKADAFDALIAEQEAVIAGDASDNIAVIDASDLPPHIRPLMSIRTTPADRPTFPTSLYGGHHGLLADVTKYITDTAPAKVPAFAVTGSLALLSTLIGTAYRTPNDGRPNISIINMAKSGTGKNHAIDTVRKLLDRAGLLRHHSLGDMLHSGSGLRQSFLSAAGQKEAEPDPSLPAPAPDPKVPLGVRGDGTSMSKLFSSDELGKFLSAHSGDEGNPNSTSLMGDFLSFFSASNGTMPGAVKVGQAPAPIPFPHLTILGASTPTALLKGLSMDAMMEGHANRFILVDADVVIRKTGADYENFFEGRTSREVPPSIIEKILALKDTLDGFQGFKSVWVDRSKMVPITPDAAKMIARIALLQDHVADLADVNREICHATFARMSEMVMRVALIAAVSRICDKVALKGAGFTLAVQDPNITLQDITFAWLLVRYSCERMAYMISREMRIEGDPQVRRVRELLEAAREKGMTEGQIMRRLQIRNHDVRSCITTLVECRMAVRLTVPGKKAAVVFLTEFAKNSAARPEDQTDATFAGLGGE
jgi:hypothetical protein